MRYSKNVKVVLRFQIAKIVKSKALMLVKLHIFFKQAFKRRIDLIKSFRVHFLFNRCSWKVFGKQRLDSNENFSFLGFSMNWVRIQQRYFEWHFLLVITLKLSYGRFFSFPEHFSQWFWRGTFWMERQKSMYLARVY